MRIFVDTLHVSRLRNSSTTSRLVVFDTSKCFLIREVDTFEQDRSTEMSMRNPGASCLSFCAHRTKALPTGIQAFV